jgi:cytochrome c-type biogenesis protein CcmH
VTVLSGQSERAAGADLSDHEKHEKHERLRGVAGPAGRRMFFVPFVSFVVHALRLRRAALNIQAFAAILFGVLSIAAASDPAERLPDAAQEARARAIFQDVRCLVCQNESIDDSEADLAHDLRQIIRGQVAQGKSDSEIKHFLTDRYGEFVLLTPTFRPANLALWGLPFLVVVAGGVLLVAKLRNRSAEPELSKDEARRLAELTQAQETPPT